jgi:hypothetical protein
MKECTLSRIMMTDSHFSFVFFLSGSLPTRERFLQCFAQASFYNLNCNAFI